MPVRMRGEHNLLFYIAKRDTGNLAKALFASGEKAAYHCTSPQVTCYMKPEQPVI